jgi:hypothetical protein
LSPPLIRILGSAPVATIHSIADSEPRPQRAARPRFCLE